jgi:hypothetical protein
LPVCWLEASIRKVLRPPTSAQVFLGFCLSKKRMLRQFPRLPSCYCMLLMWSSRLKFLRSLFYIYICIIATATWRQPTCS